MDTLSCYSPKEKMVVEALKNGISPKKLILDRTGENLFNKKYGLYPEVGVSFYNFIRNDDFNYVEGTEADEEFYKIS